MFEIIPQKMKAAFYNGFGPASEVIKIGMCEVPEPTYGEVLIKVAASGVNYHDIKKRSGWLDNDMVSDCVIPHSDGAGTIVAAGPGDDASTASCQVGEAVFFMMRARLG